jgi:hypothetical protein
MLSSRFYSRYVTPTADLPSAGKQAGAGGRPVACFNKRLMVPVSHDTLLRLMRRRAKPPTEPLNVVGIDDCPGVGFILMDVSFAI